MEYFYGILLPKGFKELEYGTLGKVFKDIERYLNDFINRSVTIEFSNNLVIGKIKSVWIDHDGNVMIAGYLTENCEFDWIAIRFVVNEIDGKYVYRKLGCSLIYKPIFIFKDCKIIERRKINLLQY